MISFSFIAVGVVAFVILMMGVKVYNGLIELSNQVTRSWANIDVMLKQRFDEIPQLVKILEQFVQYERGTIEALVNARANYGSASKVNDKIKASKEMSFALQGVVAIGENYPELKSNQNFVHLQNRISELEGGLSDRREHYNESVTNFNTRIHQVPDVFFASLLGYRSYDVFEVDVREKNKPSLKLKLPS